MKYYIIIILMFLYITVCAQNEKDKNNLTKKDLKKIRDYRLNKVLQKGEMPTIVDGYLFGVALRQKKWIGAIAIHKPKELRCFIEG